MTSDAGPVLIQVVIDCRDPNDLANFWAEALGYEKQWDCAATPAWCAVIDRTQRGPRVVFQRVAERKVVKNRVHLDMQVGQERAEGQVQRPLKIGANTVRAIELAEPPLHRRTTIMRDPEGNEFCGQYRPGTRSGSPHRAPGHARASNPSRPQSRHLRRMAAPAPDIRPSPRCRHATAHPRDRGW